MKFAKELEQDLVPEWRIKYLNYKAGKKYVKSVTRAIGKANIATPSVYSRRGELPPRKTPSSFQRRDTAATVQSTPMKVRNEIQPLTKSPGNGENYGSFVPSPPSESPLALATIDTTKHSFALPGPAIEHATGSGRLSLQRSMSLDPTIPTNQRTATLPHISPMLTRTPSMRLRRLFSSGASEYAGNELDRNDFGLHALDTVRQREQEFFDFLDGELDKVETFYKQKEEQAGQRLAILREQLHEMRNRRASELAEVKRRKKGEVVNGNGHPTNPNGESAQGWMDPIKSKIFKPGPNSKALLKMPTTPVFNGRSAEAGRDYVRKPHDDAVPYRTAKRKLKLALQEFYRGLELLKSYTLLNRTAFRKLNKKYDKAVNARPPYKYMNEKVNKSWFVNSDILDGHLIAVEDLYARYFEKGNHKIAAGKLRRLSRRPKDVSGTTFLNGIFIGTGAVFTLQGLVYGAELLFDDDPLVREQTSYLLQIYGGYFLMLYLFALFCGNCYIWCKNKINYPFIFEFDPRHHLDWRELAEFPSFCLLLLGIFIWLNFTRYGSPDMFLYYPVLLVFFTLVLILFPAPILGHRSRKWFAYSHYRLLFAGFFPVEFRDFFLGDMYCSLTYATCNIELFFCIYARSWNDPVQCNSSHSRLLGFFNALPAIWRALQCIRRYIDTKNAFPHLVNCGKYGMTILAAVMLSFYRIHNTHSNLALFVTFSTVNSIYCTIWDLFMDFSLLQPDARHALLRDILALKRRWFYYFVMVVDPILRFAWIFYAIFTHDTQHSTVVSFLLGFAEVTRRGLWAVLRVENEHCGNVAQYKASRDVPLPYHLGHEPLIECPHSEESISERDVRIEAPLPAQPPTTAATVEAEAAVTADTTASAAPTPDESGLRRRRRSEVRPGGESIRRIMAEAHRQDFEKKRRPAAGERAADAVEAGEDNTVSEEGEEDDDDDDDDDSGSVLDEREEVRRAEGLIQGDKRDD